LEKENILEVRNLYVSYGSVRVIYDLNLNIKRGEIIALLGPNGAGKTTTIKSIINIVKPTKGSIFFKSKQINKLPTHEIIKMGISIIPEGRGIFPKLTVLENLYSGAIFLNIEKSLIDQRMEIALEKFPILKKRIKQIAGTLSGGEQSMLALARAIISKPELLLMDEPSLGLAPNLIDETFELIKEFNEEGISILLIEQNAARALEICNRGYILQKGKIIIEGDREELLSDDRVKKSYFS